MTFTIVKIFEELLHGSISGIALVLTSHPIDTIKTRKQIYNFKYYNMITNMIKNEGIFSFYKGLLSPLFAVPLFKSVLFCSYKLSLIKIQENKLFWENRNLQISVASMVSGIFNSFIVGPTDLLKIKMQIQKERKNKIYNGYIDCIKKINLVSGYRGIFQGTGITIISCLLYTSPSPRD